MTSSEAARLLGMDQKTLYPLIKKFAILDYFGKKYKDKWIKKNIEKENKPAPT
jgi:hypothetical protein